ncbi:ankyrin repeat domain-containing protein [Croceicoccus sp. F390]|uniref:Ankyrin repeat domain-containing protein n=1 Tax=Croceicoccus esteveae TaxID=3075597 RepID=A0ABU2ZEW2_9SPHN|nr:ankyrin repeat domain-containing protein [Croceicoccus sp. F390]MDT0575138.1 ankyrin repeat domain-containing protein [Croceicoccus sp. F390]
MNGPGKTIYLGLGGALLLAATPALAQFSAGYKFLEAVKKRDGDAAVSALNEPGSTLINARDVGNGEGALHYVVARRDLTWLRFLLDKGADPNIRDNKGVTPLEMASSLQFLDGVEALAKAGANMNETNVTGETPLIVATHLRDAKLAQILLANGADPDRADSSGRSARNYALLAGRDNPVLAAIESDDRKAGTQATYGPVL